jgi:hypothetical protein
VTAWLVQYREFWERSFHALDGLLEEMKAAERAAHTKGRRRTPAAPPRRAR